VSECRVGYGKCGVLHFGAQAMYALEQYRTLIALGESNGICGCIRLREVPKIEFGTRRIQPLVLRPTARMSRYLSIC